jgi:hypothetical protein
MEAMMRAILVHAFGSVMLTFCLFTSVVGVMAAA